MPNKKVIHTTRWRALKAVFTFLAHRVFYIVGDGKESSLK
jgi:hypothetical protein